MGPVRRRHPKRYLLQIVERLYLILFILHGKQIIVSGALIHPITWCDHGIGIQRGNYIVDDFFLIQTQLAGTLSVDIDAQRRVIQILRNE